MECPENYARATGVVEKVRKCLECKHSFRVSNLNPTACPNCGSTKTEEVRPNSKDE